MENNDRLKDLFINPEKYNIIPNPNIWGDEEPGLFIPAYDAYALDEFGNPLPEGKCEVVEKRKK